MYKSFSLLFDKKPISWRLRGDPFLWQAMHEYLKIKPLPSNTDEVIDTITASFFYLTNHKISEDKFFKIEPFSHGGMSSGGIDPKFWHDKMIPFFCERFQQLKN